MPDSMMSQGHLAMSFALKGIPCHAVMPVETTGFHLKPVGFFKHNPALDLPRTVNTASKLASQCCGVLSANGQIGHANGNANGHTNGHANGHAAVLAEPRVATAEE